MVPTHMVRAGVDPAVLDHSRAMATLAEKEAAKLLGGEWVPPSLENATHGDVRLPNGSYVDVKFVAYRGPLSGSVVNLGDKKPPCKAVLVFRESGPGVLRPVGWAVLKQYKHGRPPEYGDASQECWYTYGRDLKPYLHPTGTPLGEDRFCPSCLDDHPAGSTCAGGWAPVPQTSLPWDDD